MLANGWTIWLLWEGWVILKKNSHTFSVSKNHVIWGKQFSSYTHPKEKCLCVEITHPPTPPSTECSTPWVSHSHTRHWLLLVQIWTASMWLSWYKHSVPVVQRLDNVIHLLNCYPLDKCSFITIVSGDKPCLGYRSSPGGPYAWLTYSEVSSQLLDPWPKVLISKHNSVGKVRNIAFRKIWRRCLIDNFEQTLLVEVGQPSSLW